jgi:hypothetical protein
MAPKCHHEGNLDLTWNQRSTDQTSNILSSRSTSILYKCNVFLPLIKHHATKMGRGGTVPPFLTLVLDTSGQVHSPAVLPRKRAPKLPFNLRAGITQNHCGKEKNLLPLPGIEPPHHLTHSLSLL